MAQMDNETKMRLVHDLYKDTVHSLKSSESAVLMRCELPTSADWDMIKQLLVSDKVAENGAKVRCSIRGITREIRLIHSI